MDGNTIPLLPVPQPLGVFLLFDVLRPANYEVTESSRRHLRSGKAVADGLEVGSTLASEFFVFLFIILCAVAVGAARWMAAGG